MKRFLRQHMVAVPEHFRPRGPERVSVYFDLAGRGATLAGQHFYQFPLAIAGHASHPDDFTGPDV